MHPLKLANPVTVLKGGVGLAGTAIGIAGTVTRRILQTALAGLDRLEEAGRRNARSEPAEPTSPAFSGPVPAEPPVPDRPPVDVVGETLAAEAAAERGDAPDGEDLAHEPRGASRDEEHGDAGLQRAEADEIAEETAAALEGDVEPEEHLTQPLLDPADTKAAAGELRTMGRAADPDPE
jgi:hypothetical protein